MADMLSQDLETRHEAPPDGRSVRISPQAAATDQEREEASSSRRITRVRDAIHDSINRWLQRFRRRNTETQNNDGQFSSVLLDTNFSIDLKETDKQIEVVAELPGLDAKDFTIETDGRRLILRGQKKEEREERDRRYYYAERRFGAFTRVIPLPCRVDASKASATYRNGVLRIVLPKAESKESRRTVRVD